MGPRFKLGLKRGSGCSVPFPPLPFLAQTAIGLAANRGEERARTESERGCAVRIKQATQSRVTTFTIQKECTSRKQKKKKHFKCVAKRNAVKQEHQGQWKRWKRGRVTTTTPRC